MPSLLLVDTELVTSTLAPELRARMPAVVVTSTSLAQARTLLAVSAFDLLLVAEDVEGQDGAAFLHEQRLARPALRTVLLSEAGMVPGVDAVILKPYNLRWMCNALWAVLRGDRPPRQRRPGRGCMPSASGRRSGATEPGQNSRL